MGIADLFSRIDDLLNYPLFSLPGHDISIKSLILLILLLWAFNRIAAWSEKIAHSALRYKDIDPGLKGSIERFSRYFVLMIGILISLSTVGFNLNSLTTFGAVIGVGIGFGLQTITLNFMSGIIILLERPIKKGDIVQVGQTSGRVLDIKARSTLVLTRDDVVIIVPNSQFITEQVVNDSFSGDKLRLCIDVGVAYDSDIEQVKETLLTVANEHSKVLQSPPATVILKSFGQYRIEFGLRIWTAELWFSDVILSDIRFAIAKSFAAQGIRVPFPQSDVHIKEWPQQVGSLPNS
jgi:small-conductance mechanosensitive channel